MTSNNRDQARAVADLPHPGASLRPLVVLMGVALAWGMAFVVVKSAVGQLPPAALVAWRFTVAAVLVVAANPRCLRHLTRRTMGRSAILGGLFGAGFLLQTWGIESTSVVVSAFIAGSVVVLAPVVARVWFGRRLGGGARLAVALATGGLAMISLRGAALGLGELLTLGAAVLWAVHLVALEVWVAREEVYASALVQLAVVALLAWTVQAISPTGVVVPSSFPAWAAVIGLGAIATGAAVVLLTWAQARVDSTSSAVVLTLEPVFGAVAAVVFGGEDLAGLTSIGAIAVVVAALVAARAGPGPGFATPLGESVLARDTDEDHDHPVMERL